MADLLKLFKTPVAQYLRIKEKEIISLVPLTTAGFSDINFKKLSAMMDIKDVAGLETASLDKLGTNEDSVFVCTAGLLSNQKYLVLMMDPYELYANSAVLKAVEL